MHALAGQTGEACSVLDELQLGNRDYVSAGRVAEIYVALGNKDAAFERAQRAVEQRDPMIVSLQANPVFHPLRCDPRYTALLRQMNGPTVSDRRMAGD